MSEKIQQTLAKILLLIALPAGSAIVANIVVGATNDEKINSLKTRIEAMEYHLISPHPPIDYKVLTQELNNEKIKALRDWMRNHEQFKH